MTKYCISSYEGKDGFVDNKTVLDPEDDVAHVKLGGSWRMPTIAEVEELWSKCSNVWVTVNGVGGFRLTGPSDPEHRPRGTSGQRRIWLNLVFFP